MLEVVGAVAGLAAIILRMVGNSEATRYLDQLTQLQLEIQEELSKPYDMQDDVRIVDLKERVLIISQAAMAQAQALPKA